MGVAVCGKIPDGGDAPPYPVKETVRADIPLEEHIEKKITAACGGLDTGVVGYFQKEMIPVET